MSKSRRGSCARHRKKFELRRLSAALKKLPAADKELIVYRYFENKAYLEIAKLLFMDITTIIRKLEEFLLCI